MDPKTKNIVLVSVAVVVIGVAGFITFRPKGDSNSTARDVGPTEKVSLNTPDSDKKSLNSSNRRSLTSSRGIEDEKEEGERISIKGTEEKSGKKRSLRGGTRKVKKKTVAPAA